MNTPDIDISGDAMSKFLLRNSPRGDLALFYGLHAVIQVPVPCPPPWVIQSCFTGTGLASQV